MKTHTYLFPDYVLDDLGVTNFRKTLILFLKKYFDALIILLCSLIILSILGDKFFKK